MNKKVLIALFVNLAIPLGGMSTDIYLPSLPAMRHYFATSTTAIQLTITLFTLGLGLGQMIAGPIADAMGRKKPFLFGLILQLFAVLLIIQAPHIGLPITMRFFQGLGAAFMMVPARAMLNDIFSGAALKKQYTYITTSFALGPIIAPFLGGYLQHYYGWQANFYFILVYVIILLLLTLIVIKETSTSIKPFSLAHMYHSYATVLQNRAFRVDAILVSFLFAYVAIFNVIGPFIVQEVLDKSAVFYGYVALFTGIAWFSGNITNRFIFAWPLYHKARIALSLTLVITLLMLILSFSTLALSKLIVPVLLIIYLSGLLFPAFIGECLSLFREQAASANGLLFSFIWLVFSGFSLIGAYLKLHSITPMAACYVVMSLLALLWFLWICVRRTN